MSATEKRFEYDGEEFALDGDGFLLNPERWNRGLAAALAAAGGVDALSEEHWRVMDFVRDYWNDHDVAPMIRLLCRETGLSLSRIYDLFPDGPAHGACKYAGLPKPDAASDSRA